MFGAPPTVAETATGLASGVQHATGELSMLSWVGGISSLCGIFALVITGGRFGWRAVIIGCCLIVLNFAIANFLSWLLAPALIGTGSISLAWSYRTVRELLAHTSQGDSDVR